MPVTFLPAGLRFGLVAPRHVNAVSTHGSQQLQGKGEAELALVHPVDEDLDVDKRALGFKPTGEVLVGVVFLLTKVFYKRLGAGLVKLARIHGGRTYMVFDVRKAYDGACAF